MSDPNPSEGAAQATGREVVAPKKKRSVLARVVLFLAMVVALAAVCGGLFVSYAIGASMSAGSGGGNGVPLIGFLFVVGVGFAAYFSFRSE
ncbi:MAG TPA: hypothetical protein VHC20_06785 [Candidatus Paceibacterota bacterium]|nr:hypothetical protein [Candidatus Paceibacterota bacterium]